jgi:hypothetical protein
LPRDPKVEGSNPSIAAGTRIDKMATELANLVKQRFNLNFTRKFFIGKKEEKVKEKIEGF